MANLRALKSCLTSLTKIDQHDLHEAIRVSRKVSKTVVRKKAKTANRTINKVNRTVSSMTPEEAQRLLDKLKKEGRI